MSTPLRQNVTFPVGRLISGSVYELRAKDAKGKPLTTKDGQPRSEVSFGVAYEKKGTQAFFQTDWGGVIYAVARGGFPSAFEADGRVKPGYKLSFKVTDGDSTEYNTAVPPSRPCDTPEWRGCWIVWFKSQFAPPTYDTRQWNPKMGGNPPPLDPKEIQCGDYVQVAGSVDSNGDAQKPGVYVNHGMVALAGYHPEGRIVRGPDVGSAGFGQGPLPTGLSTTPVGGGLPAAPLPPVGVIPPNPTLPALPTAVVLPQTAVQPHAAILQPPVNLPVPMPPVPVAPPAGPQVTAKAGGATWAQLTAAGWTEVLARQHGLIV